MKHIKSLQKIFEENNQEFPTIEIKRGNFGMIENNRKGTFVDRLLSKCFYEAYTKRNDFWSDEMISSLGEETRRYFLQLYDMLLEQRALYLNAFKDQYHKIPETDDEKIKAISGNHWGGLGRHSGMQLKVTSLPLPSSEVIEDLFAKVMPERDKQELIDLYTKLFLSKAP